MSQSDGTLALPRRLTLAEAGEWAHRLGASPAPQMRIDCAAVEECDASAVSLLLEATRRAKQRGVAIQFAGITPALQRLIDLYAVGNLLSLAE